jgi:hypothetical protein
MHNKEHGLDIYIRAIERDGRSDLLWKKKKNRSKTVIWNFEKNLVA